VRVRVRACPCHVMRLRVHVYTARVYAGYAAHIHRPLVSVQDFLSFRRKYTFSLFGNKCRETLVIITGTTVTD
jgi:hypothetical protein